MTKSHALRKREPGTARPHGMPTRLETPRLATSSFRSCNNTKVKVSDETCESAVTMSRNSSRENKAFTEESPGSSQLHSPCNTRHEIRSSWVPRGGHARKRAGPTTLIACAIS
jgi:hypothetical protein